MILAAALMVSMVGCSEAKDITVGTTEPQIKAMSQGDTAEADTMEAMEAKGTSEPLRIGLSFVSLNSPYSIRVYEQFVDEAKQSSWDVSLMDGNLDATTQLNGTQDMINNDMDTMVISTWPIGAMEDVFARCKEKGISAFIIGNTQSPDAINDLIVYACGTERCDAGFLRRARTSGYFNDLGKTELNIVIMSGSTEQMKQRGQGLVDGLTRGGIKVEMKNEHDISTKEGAAASAENALTVYSDLDLIYNVSARDSLGAYDATVRASRMEVYMVDYDGEGEELGLTDKKLNYIAAITQDPAGEVSTTVECVPKYLDGERLDEIAPISAGIYCAEGQLTSEQVPGS